MLKKSLIIVSIFVYITVLITGSPFKQDIISHGTNSFFPLGHFNQIVYAQSDSSEKNDSDSSEKNDSDSSEKNNFKSNDASKENSEKNAPDSSTGQDGVSNVNPPTGEEDNTPPTGEEDNTPPTGEEDNTPPTGEEDNTSPTGEEDNTPPTGEEDNTSPTGEEDNTPPTGEEDNTPPTGEEDNTPPTGEEDNTPPTGEEDNTESSKEENNIKDKINLEFEKITNIISKTKNKVIVKDDSDREKEIIIVSDPTCPTQSETIAINGIIDPKGIRLLANFYPCIIQNGGITMNIPESPHLKLAVIYIDNNIDNHAGTLISPSKIQSLDKTQGLFSVNLDKNMKGNDPITGELTTLEKINGLALYNNGNEPIELNEGNSVALTATFTR
jgi:hypothetical protein